MMFEGENARVLDDEAGFEAALSAPLAVIYKHSPTCGLSVMAAGEVRAFLAAHPGTPIYVVDVLEERPLSAEIARRLEVRHESPQVIVLREGAVVWHASHRAVTEEALTRESA